jgi:hypothetical protein
MESKHRRKIIRIGNFQKTQIYFLNHREHRGNFLLESKRYLIL